MDLKEAENKALEFLKSRFQFRTIGAAGASMGLVASRRVWKVRVVAQIQVHRPFLGMTLKTSEFEVTVDDEDGRIVGWNQL